MFRTGLKFRINGHNFNLLKKQKYERINSTRFYKTKSTIKSENSEKSYGGTRTLLTLGATAIGAIGILTYAKNNSEFREKLEDWIPGTDRTIQIMFQEELSYLDYILNFFESLKNKIFNALFTPDNIKPENQVETSVDYKNLENYKFPKPASDLTSLQLSANTSSEEKLKTNIQLNKKHQEKIDVVTPKTISSSSSTASENLTANLFKLEKDAGSLASKAITGFQKAAYAVQNYNKDVLNILENSDSVIEQKVWNRLKLAQEEKSKILTEAEGKADEAVEALKKLYASIDDAEFSITINQKNIIRKNISNMLSEVDNAKKKFDRELLNANISEKYWKSVKAAREKFQEELKILIPSINIEDRNLTVNNETFDLFIIYMSRKVAFLQKELEKMQTVADTKIKFALKSEGEKEKIQEAIFLEVSKETKKLQENFDKKLLEEAKVLKDKNREQLKLQIQVHADLLKEALSMKEYEMERKINRLLNEKDEEYTLKTKSEIAEVIGKLRGIDEALIAYVEADKDADKARQMWTALYSLVRAFNSIPPGISKELSLKPLKNELLLIDKVSNDPFISNIINAMPKEVFERGVYPDHILRKRFYKVEKIARRLALIPEQGAPMWAYLLSYLQSILIIQNKVEFNVDIQKPKDINSTISTFDILQKARCLLKARIICWRLSSLSVMSAMSSAQNLAQALILFNCVPAPRILCSMSSVSAMAILKIVELSGQPCLTSFSIKYWMDQGSLELSMRYMTLLEGASRMVAENWIREVQMMLEIQQSIQAMMLYTTAKSLAFIEVNDSKINC